MVSRGARTDAASAVGPSMAAASPSARAEEPPSGSGPGPGIEASREAAPREAAPRQVETARPRHPSAGAPEPDPRRPGTVGTATILMDEYGRVVDLDDAATRLLGYSRADAVGEPMSELIIPARLRAAHEAGLRRYRETGAAPLLDTRFQMPALRGDGTEILVELVVSRTVREGRPLFAGRLREIGAQAVPGELAMHADFHRTLVEQSPVMITVVDEHGREHWSTPAARALLGPAESRPLADLIGEMVHPNDADAAGALLARATTEDIDDSVDLRLRAPDGTWRALSVLARNLLDHPAVHGVAFYCSDVTRARVAEQQRRVEAARLMTLLESLSVGVLLQDEHRRVVLANAAFVELFDLGLPPERLRDTERDGGLPHLRVDSAGAAERADRIMGRGRPVVGEEIVLRTGRVLERDYTPITMDGATLGHLWVYRDVTAQAEVRRSLEERNRMLSELASLKTEFVHVVSHELRTPLTSINTFANILDDGIELPPEEHAAAISALRRNADRMLALVADLILLAKLESGEIRLATLPVDLPAMVRDVIARTPQDSVDVVTEIADGPRFDGDPALLGQLTDTAVGVLVSGSAEGAQVRVRATASDGRWVLEVATSAAGAATSERLLSTRLPHPDAPDEQRTGALALMLARAIAARHGGDLTLERTQPGATITVTLPVQPPS